MENLFSELKQRLGIDSIVDSLWILRRQLAAIQGAIVNIPQYFLRIEIMNREVKEALEALKLDVQNESAEVKQVIEASVSKAIAPLQETIAKLEAQIAEGEDPSATLAELQEIAEEVKAIVTPEATSLPENPSEDAGVVTPELPGEAPTEDPGVEEFPTEDSVDAPFSTEV